jgi:hypothetical protein
MDLKEAFWLCVTQEAFELPWLTTNQPVISVGRGGTISLHCERYIFYKVVSTSGA